MDLLGNYQGTLTKYQFQELVSLLQTSIQQGAYSGGNTFSQADLEALQAQGQAFTTLPQPSSGQRSSDDCFNNPINLLSARFSAILSETLRFDQQLSNLTSTLQSNTDLIDKLIFAAELNNWLSILPYYKSNKFSWSFGSGFGLINPGSYFLDPLTNTSYTQSKPLLITTFLGNKKFTGLTCNSTVTGTVTTGLSWNYTGTDKYSVQSGKDWTSLTVTTGEPVITYTGSPVVSPTNPFFSITGTSFFGNLPFYVKISHTPRLNMYQSSSLVVNSPVTISNYVVSANDVFVTEQAPGPNLYEYPNLISSELPIITSTYTQGIDYTITDNGIFIPLSSALVGENVNIQFTEYFPSYQCSTDQTHWSPLLMLDPLRPYQDNELTFMPFSFGPGNSFPITDESGVPSGLCISLNNATTVDDYLLTIYSYAAPNTVGVNAVLEVDFGEFQTLNALTINPFCEFPLVLKEINLQGQSSLVQTNVWTGSTVLDSKTTLRFPLTIASKIYLSFYQPNYTIIQSELDSNSNLQRDIIQQLQASVPSAAQIKNNTQSNLQLGYNYEFGLQDIIGQNIQTEDGIFKAGPYLSSGSPDSVILNAEYTTADMLSMTNTLVINATQGNNFITVISGSGFEDGQTIIDPTGHIASGTKITGISGNTLGISTTVSTSLNNAEVSLSFVNPVDFYLTYTAYDSGSNLIDSNLTGVPIIPGVPLIFPFNHPFIGNSSNNVSDVDHIVMYLLICHRHPLALLDKFQLEVINA